MKTSGVQIDVLWIAKHKCKVGSFVRILWTEDWINESVNVANQGRCSIEKTAKTLKTDVRHYVYNEEKLLLNW